MSFSEAAKDMDNMAAANAEAPQAHAGEPAKAEAKKPALKVVRDVNVDHTRDALITEFGKTT